VTYVFDVVFDAYSLLRRTPFDGTAAPAPSASAVDLEAAALTGSLTLEPVTVNLPGPPAAEAPHIEIREINTNATSNHKGQAEDQRFPDRHGPERGHPQPSRRHAAAAWTLNGPAGSTSAVETTCAGHHGE
jgi:hypothetical protein